MDPIKITFRFLNARKFTEYEFFNVINQKSNLNCMAVFMGRRQVTLQISNAEQLQPLLVDEGTEFLTSNDLQLVEHNSVKAKRTVFVPSLPSYICNTQREELINLINDSNPTLDVEDIFYVGSATSRSAPKTNLKILFAKPSMAQEAKNNGIHFGNFFAYSERIFKEDYIRPPQCNKCFSLMHITTACTSPTPKCSRCAGDHEFIKCDADEPKCINCEGNHTAIYASCPVYKDMINVIRQNKRKRSNNEQATHHQQPQFQPAPSPTFNAWHQPFTPSPQAFNNPPLPTRANNNLNQQTPWTPQVNVPCYKACANNTSSPTAPSAPPPPSPFTQPCAQPNLSQPPPTLPTQTPPPSFTPPPPSNTPPRNKFILDEVQLQYNTFDKFATDIAAGDKLLYMRIMNKFFRQFHIEEIKIDDELINLATGNQNIKESKETTTQTDMVPIRKNVICQTVVSQESHNFPEESINSDANSSNASNSNTDSFTFKLTPMTSTPEKVTTVEENPIICTNRFEAISKDTNDIETEENESAAEEELSDISEEDEIILENITPEKKEESINITIRHNITPPKQKANTAENSNNINVHTQTDDEDDIPITAAQKEPRHLSRYLTRSASSENLVSNQGGARPKKKSSKNVKKKTPKGNKK